MTSFNIESMIKAFLGSIILGVEVANWILLCAMVHSLYSSRFAKGPAVGSVEHLHRCIGKSNDALFMQAAAGC